MFSMLRSKSVYGMRQTLRLSRKNRNVLQPGELEPEPPRPAYLFYRTGYPPSARATDLPADYAWSIWKPTLKNMMPNGMAHYRKRLASRWIMHQLRLFSNREYQVLMIRHTGNRDIVHYSGATGGYWRWPFMHAEDMQIGDTWTDPTHRGRGLARFALVQLLRKLGQPGRHIWYVVGEDNAASIAVAEAGGMTLAGQGMRSTPRVFRFLHAYEINHSAENKAYVSRGDAAFRS
jgi:RimJ/RimL family protein N-acetyltransferase